jgi:diacylglycerol kinase (ATP)
MSNDAGSAIVFVNRCAGGGNAGRKIAGVRAEFARQGFAVRFVESRSAKDFRRGVCAAIAAGSRTLIAMGGDGTLQLLVREAIGSPVNAGVIPVGGGNDFAAALGVRNWKQAVEIVAKGKTRAVDVVRATFANGETAEYLGGGGVGLDAEAARYARGKFLKWPGRLRYVASAVAALRGYSGVHVEFAFPENGAPALRKRLLLAAALNTPSYGGGLRLAPEARIDDGQLDFVTIDMLSRREMARLLPRLLFTGELQTGHLTRFRVTRARLSAEEEVGGFHGDGELLGATPVEIEVLPKAIRMFAP